VTPPNYQPNSSTTNNCLPITTTPLHLSTILQKPSLPSSPRTSAHRYTATPPTPIFCIVVLHPTTQDVNHSIYFPKHGFKNSPRCRKREQRGYLSPLMPTPVPLEHPFPLPLQPSKGIPHFLPDTMHPFNSQANKPYYQPTNQSSNFLYNPPPLSSPVNHQPIPRLAPQSRPDSCYPPPYT
jgi:hypothetical protein